MVCLWWRWYNLECMCVQFSTYKYGSILLNETSVNILCVYTQCNIFFTTRPKAIIDLNTCPQSAILVFGNLAEK